MDYVRSHTDEQNYAEYCRLTTPEHRAEDDALVKKAAQEAARKYGFIK